VIARVFESGVADRSHARGSLALPGGRSLTFTHHSATLPRGVHCPGHREGDNSEARLGRRGGTLSGSATSGGPPVGGGSSAASRPTRHRSGVGPSDLGSGGATAWALTSEGQAGVCQEPPRSRCLSLRCDAAGPEWRRAPCNASLALIQRLGQLSVSVFLDLLRFSRRVIPAKTTLHARRSGAKHARSYRCETPLRQTASARTPSARTARPTWGGGQ
jgi:hypothetical protein